MSVPSLSGSQRIDPLRPRSPLNAASEPFVGNITVDDNLAEAVQIVLWKLARTTHRPADISVANGVVTLRGSVDSASQCHAVETAISRIAGVRAVVNELEIASAKSMAPRRPAGLPAPTIQAVESHRFLYLVRYCGLIEASLSAAIREAVSKLDGLFVSHSLDLPDTLFVLYRNQHADMVTLEIGMPLTEDVLSSGEFHIGSTPGGSMMTAAVAPGLASFRAATAALLASARGARLEPADYFWQRFDGAFRAWQGHPEAVVFLPVVRLPRTGVSEAEATL